MSGARENRVALVVGAGQGIGAAVAAALAADGLTVAVADRNLENATRVAETLGARHKAFGVDVRDPQGVEALFDDVAASLGPVTVLVNTAAISPMPPDGEKLTIADTPDAMWRDVFDINAFGTFLLGRTYARRVATIADHGRVVLLSSAAAQIGGHRSCAAYIGSKAAVIGFGKALARELAPAGVTVNCVAPGLIETPMLRQGLLAENDARATAAVPLGRIGSPEEVAQTVRFLVSPEAAYITGATLDVNGGYNMR